MAESSDARHIAECDGCGATNPAECLCRARDDREPTPEQIEAARRERLSAHERESEAT